MLLYVLTSPSGKQYVGITSTTVEHRFSGHKTAAKKGARGPLYQALRKYGADAFRIEVVAVADSWQQLCEMELDAIAGLETRTPHGYNVTRGGDGVLGVRSFLGRRHSDATKQAIRAKALGRGHTAETRAKCAAAAARRGKITPEGQARVTAAHLGAKRSEATRARLREAWAHRKINAPLTRDPLTGRITASHEKRHTQ